MPASVVTVVTGASTGIGRAVAERQARAGDSVWALVRDPGACTELAALAEAERLDLRIVKADVADDRSVDAAFDIVLGESGHVDRFVNNAGLFYGSTLEANSLDEIRAVFEVNYFGAIRCIRRVLPGMRDAGGGVIAAVTSQSSQAIFPTWTAYAGSKSALEGSLESIAMEVAGFGIRVAIVQPGITLTAMRGKITPRTNPEAYAHMLDRYRTLIAADRTESMVPDDVALAIQGVLDDPASPFRTRVGADAVRNIALRESVTDEQWVGLFGLETDDEFYEQWMRMSGLPDPRVLLDESLADPR